MRYVIFVLLFSFLLSSCLGRRGNSYTTAAQDKSETPKYGYTIKRIFPHNTSSYTQGLIISNSQMFEGTGQYGQSAIMKTDLSTGKVIQNSNLTEHYFGEGITLFDNKLYQLTWQEKTLFIYDAQTLKPLQEIIYAGEGWGLTSDSTYIYMSNGSSNITIRDPKTFDIVRSIEVKFNRGNRVTGLNELEWIEGEIWANIYMSDVIVRINPDTGIVTGVIDLDGLLPDSERTPATDVLNGIAYDSNEKRIYVTGKNWSKLFEIELVKK